MAYTTSNTGIIHELLDDEVIIANLNEGIYYSIRGSGILIWQLLLAGHTLPSIESLFSEKYGAISNLAPFLDRLLKENLLISAPNSSPSTPSLSWPATFFPPGLERYDEMQNLLKFDPIHEVDEQGWPQQKVDEQGWPQKR